ncbi:hypothetical protein Mal4_28590 [Maioricimonas rarisocia]|uniref:Uncharacterized protein n=1 Tax=Maioricimonas rarisocia TaxID=2528026 RepID=A0A517Z7R1_9PLAN|nr:hypothetical protein [Maioricimonas rarisocia]QDU38530.1 hypothetical protein Mal4_28590 [Maioricimonas rarisocia]
MKWTFIVLGVLGTAFLLGSPTLAQDAAEAPPAEEAAETDTAEDVQERAGEVIDETRDRVGKIAAEVDQSEQAKEVSAGILQPIYLLAEFMAFPTFHWIAFAVMVTGVISFALQLVLTKLVVLMKMGFSPTEILADALGLVISLVGLVLTTQAAAENSTFTTSPAAVLSATAVGFLAGFIFWRWGHAHELHALKGRSAKK